MTAQITLNLSDPLLKRVRSLARWRERDLAEAITEYLDSHLPETDFDEEPTLEMKTFIAMYPMLKEKYFGQYVAIYQGKLIDHDTDRKALYLRIDEKYPDEFVWISPVEEEPIPTLVFRSPRLEATPIL